MSDHIKLWQLGDYLCEQKMNNLSNVCQLLKKFQHIYHVTQPFHSNIFPRNTKHISIKGLVHECSLQLYFAITKHWKQAKRLSKDE